MCYIGLLAFITECLLLMVLTPFLRILDKQSWLNTQSCSLSHSNFICKKFQKDFVFISSPELFNTQLSKKPTPSELHLTGLYRQAVPASERQNLEQRTQLWSNYLLSCSYFNSLAESCQQGAVIESLLFGCLQARSNSNVLLDSGKHMLQ